MAPQLSDALESGYLRATLRIKPASESGCSVVTQGGRSENITQNVVDSSRCSCEQNQESDGSECSCEQNQECCVEVSDEGGTSSQFFKRPVSSYCICPVFSEHDCIPSIEAYEHEEFVVSISVRTRDELASIIESLRNRKARVRLQQITSSQKNTDGRRLELETETITDKQREAVETAIQTGYYETPRRANLADLADELDVSRSAVSQRLTAIESKLVAQLYQAQHGQPDVA